MVHSNGCILGNEGPESSRSGLVSLSSGLPASPTPKPVEVHGLRRSSGLGVGCQGF